MYSPAKRIKNSLPTVIFIIFFACTASVSSLAGDLCDDYRFGLEDLLALSAQWLDEFGCVDHPDDCADLVGNDGVDMADFGVLSADWLDTFDLKITEFMASNSSTLQDEDNDYPDWIEIFNPHECAINLAGWYLTEDRDDLTQWRFPDITMEGNDYLVVFASEKDRSSPGGQLHTNFKLAADGDYLGLVRPDGTTVTSEFAPTYPPQVGNISYGSSVQMDVVNLVDSASTIHFLVPDDDSLGTSWTSNDFTESENWKTGLSGIGFDIFGMGSFPIPPQAHWTFDEPDGLNAFDSSGNDSHGTLQGNPVRVEGHIGSGALKFSGGIHVNCGAEPGSSSNLTFSLWIKPSSPQLGRPLTKITPGSSPGSGYTVMLRPDSADAAWDKAIIVRIGADDNYGGWGYGYRPLGIPIGGEYDCLLNEPCCLPGVSGCEGPTQASGICPIGGGDFSA